MIVDIVELSENQVSECAIGIAGIAERLKVLVLGFDTNDEINGEFGRNVRHIGDFWTDLRALLAGRCRGESIENGNKGIGTAIYLAD